MKDIDFVDDRIFNLVLYVHVYIYNMYDMILDHNNILIFSSTTKMSTVLGVCWQYSSDIHVHI